MPTIEITALYCSPTRGRVTRTVVLSCAPHPDIERRFVPRQVLAYGTEEGAAQGVERNARYLTFADLTGLRLSRAFASLYPVRPRRIGFDHTFAWHAGRGLGRIVTVEPYRNTLALEQWCKAAEWRYAVAAIGVGMWFPPFTRLLVAAPRDRGGDPDEVVRRLEAGIAASGGNAWPPAASQ